uniref:Large ribosomal subunit protein bL33m n=1 Tax=Nothobranchius furzeri TaxID=105023 RepID=A0A8C6NZZ4_NOTFU
MFLTTVNLAKAKSKTILVQMVSAAGTGYFFNTKRNRLKEKLVLRKHDPFGEIKIIRAEHNSFLKYSQKTRLRCFCANAPTPH